MELDLSSSVLRPLTGSVGGMSTTGYRTLADQLRSWPDERLSRLLHERPDLATPAPHDSGQLASRAATRSSLLRALDQLTRAELCVLDALVVVGQTTEAELADGGERPTRVGRGRRTTAARPGAGLGDPAGDPRADRGRRARCTVQRAAPGLGRARRPPTTCAARLDELSPAARALLEHVARVRRRGDHRLGPAHGAARGRRDPGRGAARAPAAGPAQRRRRGAARRGRHRAARRPHDDASRSTSVPELATAERGQDAGRPGRRRRGVRGRTPRRAAAGRVGPDAARVAAQRRARRPRPQGDRRRSCTSTSRPPRCWSRSPRPPGCWPPPPTRTATRSWIPTDAFDAVDGPAGRRALDRAASGPGWPARGCPAWSGRATRRARSGTRSPPSSPAATRSRAGGWRWTRWRRCRRARCWPRAPASRRWCAGSVWLRPRRPRTRADQVAWAVDEAAVARRRRAGRARRRTPGRCSPATRPAATAALAALLPEPVDHVLLQADLTAVAPGPLESQLARRLQLVADVESRGGATVYRFTPGSVRRALDTGWSAAEVHEFIGSVSRTPVPQPLSYLVDDTARTFGSDPGRPRRGVPARRRRDRADRAAAPPEGRHPRAAPDRADGAGQLDAARRAAAAAARPRRRAGRRGRRRHRPRRPAATCCAPARPASTAAAAAYATARESAQAAHAVTRDPGRRPGGADADPRQPQPRSPRAARWPRCARRSRPGRPC